MNKAVTPHRWFHGWRASQPGVEVDAADLGTAFGLDLSLNEIAHEAQRASTPPSRRLSWLRHLTAKRPPSN